MAATKYAQHTGKALRRPGVMPRHEWSIRAKELATRGQDLTQSRLLDMDVIDIRSAARQRAKLVQYIRDNLSNAALARRHGVHVRSVEKILSYETWGHLP